MKKRFVEIDDGLDFSIKHIESGEIFYDCESVVDILNELADENEQLKQQLQKIHKLIDDNIKIYEDTTTNDDFLQIQLDTKLQTLYNLRKELFK